MIVMMQKEVALRICGKPSTKDYNALSVLVQYKHHASILFDVPKGCFYPEPDVTSSIVKIKRFNQDILPVNEEFFYSFNRNIFKQRRKTFANNVKSAYPVSKEDVENILTSLGYSVTIRSEALDIYDIIKLSDAFYHLLNK
jgi:16S rRNA (adenine1518-N6/adenine1519-N6)-dimethyltransferase